MSNTVYMFEAHSIQQYVLKGGTLRDMVCASELIESLVYFESGPAAELRELGIVLNQLELRPDDNCWFSRLGGAAFYLFIDGDDADEKARKLRDLWYLTVKSIVPDLPFCHTVARGDYPSDAISKGKKKLRLSRNPPVAEAIRKRRMRDISVFNSKIVFEGDLLKPLWPFVYGVISECG